MDDNFQAGDLLHVVENDNEDYVLILSAYGVDYKCIFLNCNEFCLVWRFGEKLASRKIEMTFHPYRTWTNYSVIKRMFDCI